MILSLRTDHHPTHQVCGWPLFPGLKPCLICTWPFPQSLKHFGTLSTDHFRIQDRSLYTFLKKRTSSRIVFCSYIHTWFNISKIVLSTSWMNFNGWDTKTNKSKIKAWINLYLVCLQFSWSFTRSLMTLMESVYNNQLSFMAGILT